MSFKCGQVWLANLNPNNGKEPGKTRPVVIIQDQFLLDAEHPTSIILPLTTQLIDKAFPLRVRVNATGKLDKASDILIDQVRAIDNRRLMGEPLAKLPSAVLDKVYSALNEVLGAWQSG